MASTDGSTSELGSRVVLAGLLVQIIIFGVFVVVALIFHRRLHAMPTHKSREPSSHWERIMYTLYATCALILVRNIVRMAEFVEGFQGFVILHEVFLYVFDGVPMAAVLITFLIWYPSNISKRARTAKLNMWSEESDLDLSNLECAEGGVKHQSLKRFSGITARLGRLMTKN